MSHDVNAIEALFALPFNDLLFRAHSVHRAHFDPNTVQRSTLLSIKTGGCSEDCGYCSQSARFDTAVEREPLLPLADVVAAAQAAKERGATRFCMGAAWRGPKDKDLEAVIAMVRAVKALGLETCVTLGQLREGQAEKLKAAGLDYYNHNLDTSREHYSHVVHTHSYDDRLATLRRVRDAGLNVCCGGIMGMGESRRDRAAFLAELAALDPAPESVPLNMLVKVPGTPLGEAPASREQGPHQDACGDATVVSRARPPEAMTQDRTRKPTSSHSLEGYAPVVPQLEPLEFVRTIAVARIAMPRSYVRLSAGRQEMPDHLQALCFFAGANSIFYGDKLLTTSNPESDRDQALFADLGLQAMAPENMASAKAARAAS